MPQKVNRPGRRGDAGPHTHRAQRAHAEFPGLHPLRQRAELPVRTRLPRVHRLPHGGGELSASSAPCAGTPPKKRSSRPRNGLRILPRTDPPSQSRARIRRGGNRAARHGMGRRPDLPAGSDPQAGKLGLHGRDFSGRTGRRRAGLHRVRHHHRGTVARGWLGRHHRGRAHFALHESHLSRWAATSSADAIFRSWHRANGSAAGR